jgi:DNA polymerase-3 subunit gamma/tau
MAVLYRDYRPKSFSEVIDQEHIKKTLQNAAASGNFSHAYLFTGPRGTGKTSVARIFARAINCLNPSEGQPCNKCEICVQFLEGKSLDLIEIDAASNTGVENIRDIIEHLKFSPSQAKFKVFIIDEVHMLSKGAFNALLKTLEEPPAHAVFILATTEANKVPATVISRSQRFDFKKLQSDKLFEHLKAVTKAEKIQVDQETLQLVVRLAEGSGRDALSILDKLSAYGKMDFEQAEKVLGVTNIIAAQRFLDLLASKNASASLQFLEEMFSAGADPLQFNRDFLEYLRKVLMLAAGAENIFALDENQQVQLKKHAAQIPQAHLLYIIRLFLRANKDFQSSPSLELPMEIAAAESCLDSVYKATDVSGLAANNDSFAAKSRGAAAESSKIITEGFSALKQEENLPAISFTEVLEKWPKVLSQLKEDRSSLLAVLKNAKLKNVLNNCVVLEFSYKFHKDAIDNPRNAKYIISIMQEKFKSQMSLQTVLEKSQQQKITDASSVALDVFGGELV